MDKDGYNQVQKGGTKRLRSTKGGLVGVGGGECRCKLNVDEPR